MQWNISTDTGCWNAYKGSSKIFWNYGHPPYWSAFACKLPGKFLLMCLYNGHVVDRLLNDNDDDGSRSNSTG